MVKTTWLPANAGTTNIGLAIRNLINDRTTHQPTDERGEDIRDMKAMFQNLTVDNKVDDSPITSIQQIQKTSMPPPPLPSLSDGSYVPNSVRVAFDPAITPSEIDWSGITDTQYSGP
jgi:hypothetical protein